MSAERRAIVLRPLLVAAGLLALGAVSLSYALLPGMPWKLGVALGIVAVQGSLVAAAFMGFGRAGPLVRATALIAIVWLGFLFVMASADLATR